MFMYVEKEAISSLDSREFTQSFHHSVCVCLLLFTSFNGFDSNGNIYV